MSMKSRSTFVLGFSLKCGLNLILDEYALQVANNSHDQKGILLSYIPFFTFQTAPRILPDCPLKVIS